MHRLRLPRSAKSIGLGAVVSLAVLSLAIYFASARKPSHPRHFLDGQGFLASTENHSSIVSGSFRASAKGPWTLGYRLCIENKDEAVTIDSVGPTRTVGSGFAFLGALARNIRLGSGDGPIGGVRGFPPVLPTGSAHPDKLYPAKGFTVAVPCASTASYSELLIGWDTRPSGEGGGWLGIDVHYSVGHRKYVVSLPYNILVCGPAVFDDAPHACPSATSPQPTEASG